MIYFSTSCEITFVFPGHHHISPALLVLMGVLLVYAKVFFGLHVHQFADPTVLGGSLVSSKDTAYCMAETAKIHDNQNCTDKS